MIFPLDPVPQNVFKKEVQFRTLISNFENGVEQRRDKWPSGKPMFTLQYDSLTPAEIGVLWNFYNACLGAYQSFTFYDIKDYDNIDYTELVTNGAFATDSGWTKGTGWSIAGGVASKVAGVASNLSQAISISAASLYRLLYTITARTAGTLTPQVGGVNGGVQSIAGTYEDMIVAVSSGGIFFQADSSFAGSINDASVILVSSTLTPYTVRFADDKMSYETFAYVLMKTGLNLIGLF